MVVFGTVCLKAQHQVAHTVPRVQLAEDHAEHLVLTGKAPDIFVSIMGLDDTVEHAAGQELGNLGEYKWPWFIDFLTKILFPDSNRQAIENYCRYHVQRISKNLD